MPRMNKLHFVKLIKVRNLQIIMKRNCLRTFLHASCLLLMVKCSEQTKKGTVEEFHKVMQQNFATCDKIDTEKTGNVITYQSNEDIGLNDFVQTCRELNSEVHENDVLSLILVRKCYKRKDENKKDHIANIIRAMQRYLANPEKQLLHVNNLEVAIYTLRYKDTNDFDFAEKNLNNSEKNLKEISFMINESVVKFILTSVKSAFVDIIAEKLADDKFEVLLRQHSDQKLIMSDVDDFCDSMFEKLTGITYMTELEDFFLKIDRNEILWRRLMHEVFEKIDRYQTENNFMVIDRENTIVEKKISDKLYEDVKTHLEEVLTLVWPTISDRIKNSGKERFKINCSFFNFILRGHDLRIFWNRYNKRNVVLDPPRPSIYQHIKSANCTGFAEVFEYYFDQMNFDKLINDVTPIVLANKRDDIESTFYCNEKILILCHGEMTEHNMSYLCKVLIQTKILESQSIYRSLYFNDQYNLTMPDIRKFDRKCSEKRLQQSANQQALFVLGFLGIFHRKLDFEGKMAFVKYTMGNDTVDHDNPINKTSSGDALVCNESLMPMRLLLKDVGPVKFNTLNDLFNMPESIVSIWAEKIGLSHKLPSKVFRIIFPENEIILLSDNNDIKTSMVYNIPHLHLIFQNNQLRKPEEIHDGIWFFEDIADTFLDNLNSFLQIYFLTGKLCDIKNTYLTFASDYHYAEMSITYHVPLNKVNSEGRGGMYDYFENAIDKISETPGNHFRWSRYTLDKVKKHSNFGHRKNQFKFGSNCLVGQDECINSISASFVIEKRHAKGLTYHPAFGWVEPKLLVRMYMIERNNREIGAFILRRELKEQIDSSIASLPLLILDKILSNPSNVYQRYFEYLGLGNDKIRFETRLICWIYKFYPIHHCRWDVDDFTDEKYFAKEKVKEMCRDYVQKAVDLKTLKRKWFDFTSNEGLSQPDDFSIEKCIGKLVDFVFGFIDASHQKKRSD